MQWRGKPTLAHTYSSASTTPAGARWPKPSREVGLKAASAGTIPSPRSVNPTVVQVMKEKGIDISSNAPKLLTTDMINERHASS